MTDVRERERPPGSPTTPAPAYLLDVLLARLDMKDVDTSGASGTSRAAHALLLRRVGDVLWGVGRAALAQRYFDASRHALHGEVDALPECPLLSTLARGDAGEGPRAAHRGWQRVGELLLVTRSPRRAVHYLDKARRLVGRSAHGGAQHRECLLLLAQAQARSGLHDAAEATLRKARALAEARGAGTAIMDTQLRAVAADRARHRQRTQVVARRDAADSLFFPLPTAEDLNLSPTTLRAMFDAHTMLGSLAADAAQCRASGLAGTSLLREARACAALAEVHLALREVLDARLPGLDAGVEVARFLGAAELLADAAGSGPVGAKVLEQAAVLLAHDRTQRMTFTAAVRRELDLLADWVDTEHDIPVLSRLAVAYRRVHTIPTPDSAALARLYLAAIATRLDPPGGHRPPMSTWIAADAERHHRLLATATDDEFTAHLAAAVADACRVERVLVDRLDTVAGHLLGARTAYDDATRALIAAIPAAPVLNNELVAVERGITRRGAAFFTERLVALHLLVHADDHRPGRRRLVQPQALALLAAPHPAPEHLVASATTSPQRRGSSPGRRRRTAHQEGTR